MRLIFLLLIFLGGFQGFSQDKLKFGDTGKTNNSPTYKPNDKVYKQRRPVEWIKNGSKGLLLGNRCMDGVHDDMGFIYVIQRKGQSDTVNEFHRFFHNLTAKTKIMFKNGLFWKFKLKKKRRECRQLSGDYVG